MSAPRLDTPVGTSAGMNRPEASGPVISVVVADDHEVVRAGFAALLDTQPDFTVLGTAADGAERGVRLP